MNPSLPLLLWGLAFALWSAGFFFFCGAVILFAAMVRGAAEKRRR